MRRVYVRTHCASSHNRVAEGAKSLLGSSSALVLFALPSSVTQNTFEFNTESLCLSSHFLSPHPSADKSIKNQDLLHKHSVLIGLYINLIHYIDHYHHTNFQYFNYYTRLALQIFFKHIFPTWNFLK